MPVELPKAMELLLTKFVLPETKTKPEVCHETELWRDLDLSREQLKKINFL